MTVSITDPGEEKSSKVGEGEEENGVNDAGSDEKTFHFVIKSPPTQAFIRLMHKLTKPFLNEVTWYQDLLKQVSLVEKQLPAELSLASLCLSQQCPVVYHAHSNYYSGEASRTCSSCPWFCSLPLRQAEEGILVMEVTASLSEAEQINDFCYFRTSRREDS